MGTVVGKIKCLNPAHEEDTPSLAVYDDGSGYCFGCQSYFRRVSQPKTVSSVEKEDIAAKIGVISSLPVVNFRGCSFPHDREGYYIVWPDKSYYKLRYWAPKGPKYKSPKGHQKPWFWASHKGSRTLALVEGEINAISLSRAVSFDVVSPGSIGDFINGAMKDSLHMFRSYDTIYVCVDKDVGVTNALKFKELVKPFCQDVAIVLLTEDFNEMLVRDGEEKFSKKVRDLGLL